jgi:hypothetical protein
VLQSITHRCARRPTPWSIWLPVAQGTPAPPAVIVAIEQDSALTARQRKALAEVYTAMTEATAARARWDGDGTGDID